MSDTDTDPTGTAGAIYALYPAFRARDGFRDLSADGLADVVQEVMLEVFEAPDRDRYQIITVHPVGHIIAEDTNLGLERTDELVILQIFQQGRTDDHKRAAYARLAERLEGEVGLRPSDLIV